MSDSDNSLLDNDGFLAGDRPARQLILNRPEKRNALTVRMMSEFVRLLTEAPQHTLIIAGQPPAFCSGLDLDEMAAIGSPAEHLHALTRVFESLDTHPSPIVSLVGGPARAGGAALACFADTVLVSSTATFGIPTKPVYQPMTELILPLIAARRQLLVDALRLLLQGGVTAEAALDAHLVDGILPIASFSEVSPAILNLPAAVQIPRLAPGILEQFRRRWQTIADSQAGRELIEHLRIRRNGPQP